MEVSALSASAGDNRPEIPLQDTENMESAPGNSVIARSSQAAPPDLIQRRREAASKDAPVSSSVSASWNILRQAQDEGGGLASVAPASDERPENPLQSTENVDSAPAIATGAPRGAADSADFAIGASKNDALRDTTLRVAPQHEGQGGPSHGSGRDERPENPAQDLENVESAPGLAEDARSSGGAPAGPALLNPAAGFRRINVQMGLNGLYAG
jgi:hypothetical protein